MTFKKKVLFILHDASRTGAPLVLYHFLKRLKADGVNSFDILLLGDGPMFSMFNELCSVHFFSKKPNLFHRLLSKLTGLSAQVKLKNFLLKESYDLYYINSSASLPKLPTFDFITNSNSILHVHELDVNIRQTQASEIIKNYIGGFSKVICVSNLVLSNLINQYGLDESKSCIIYPFSREVNKKNLLKADIGLPKNAFVIGGCGSLDLTKGLDVFLQVAYKVNSYKNLDRPIFFCWLGDRGNPYYVKHIKADIIKMGLINCVKILETTENPEEIFFNFDAFFMPSREDAFPLVGIENAKLGIPIICFDKGNGFAEVINETNGFKIPYQDTLETAKAILKLYEDEVLCTRMCQSIEQDSRVFDSELIYSKMLNCINEC